MMNAVIASSKPCAAACARRVLTRLQVIRPPPAASLTSPHFTHTSPHLSHTCLCVLRPTPPHAPPPTPLHASRTSRTLRHLRSALPRSFSAFLSAPLRSLLSPPAPPSLVGVVPFSVSWPWRRPLSPLLCAVGCVRLLERKRCPAETRCHVWLSPNRLGTTLRRWVMLRLTYVSGPPDASCLAG
jgi:hypothetical protein